MIRKLLLGFLAGLTLNGVSVSFDVLNITMEWSEN